MKSFGFSTKVVNVDGRTKRPYLYDEAMVKSLRRRYSLEYVKEHFETPENYNDYNDYDLKDNNKDKKTRRTWLRNKLRM